MWPGVLLSLGDLYTIGVTCSHGTVLDQSFTSSLLASFFCIFHPAREHKGCVIFEYLNRIHSFALVPFVCFLLFLFGYYIGFCGWLYSLGMFSIRALNDTGLLFTVDRAPFFIFGWYC